MRKPRHIYALHLCQKSLGNIKELQSSFGPAVNRKDWPRREDIEWLRKFLADARIMSYLKFLDVLTDGTELTATSDSLRPSEQEMRDSLRALSDVWVQLETFVMQTQETEEPEAHELYDLLADPHIREVLVAYDDIANSRYSALAIKEGAQPATTVQSYGPPINQSASPDLDQQSVVTNGEDSLVDVTVLSGPPMTHLSETSAKRLVEPRRSQGHHDRLGNPEDGTDGSDGGFDEGDDEVTYKSTKTETVRGGTGNARGVPPPTKEEAKRPAVLRPTGSDSLQHSGDRSSLAGTKKNATISSTTGVRKPLRVETDDTSRGPATRPLLTHKPPLQPNHRTPLQPSSGSPQSPSRHDLGSPRSSLRSNASPAPRGKATPPTSPGEGTPQGSLRRRQPVSSDDQPNSPLVSRKESPPAPRGRGQLGRQPPPSREPGQVRSVRLRRDHPGESIGITVAAKTPPPSITPTGKQAGASRQSDQQREGAGLVIQRVIAGSLADRQGGLYPGDFLLEFNGKVVHSLDEVHNMMRQTSGSLDCHFVVESPPAEGLLQPGLQRKLEVNRTKRFIRCFFTYDASRDSLMPAGDIGMSFKSGEVLELVDNLDPLWWQVRSLKDPNGPVRMVPSQTLEERRQAFNQEKAQGTSISKKFKRQVKGFFRAADSSCLRLRADLWCYEEVVPWPPTMVPCLLLLGPTGVGRRNLKVLLANQQPKRFGFPLSETTDPTASINNFQILQKAQMEKDIRDGAYVEWGQVNGHYYGIRFSAIRKIIDSGRTAVLDCQPQTVHLLHQPEFNPCAVFIAAPDFEVAKQMLQDGLRDNLTKNNRSDADLRQIIEESQASATQHRHLYSHLLVNSNMQETMEKLCRLVLRIERQPSWIPASWAYELSVSGVGGSDRASGLPPRLLSNFIPGSSSLSALGIHGLPPSRASVIAPSGSSSLLSGVSAASPESALRLSRPPVGRRGCSPAVGVAPIYERRQPRRQGDRRPPEAIQEQDTPASSVVSPVGGPGEAVVAGTDSDLEASRGERVGPTPGSARGRQQQQRWWSSGGDAAERGVGRQTPSSKSQANASLRDSAVRARDRQAPPGQTYGSTRAANRPPPTPRDSSTNEHRTAADRHHQQRHSTARGGARPSQVEGRGRAMVQLEDDISSTSSEDDAAEEFPL